MPKDKERSKTTGEIADETTPAAESTHDRNADVSVPPDATDELMGDVVADAQIGGDSELEDAIHEVPPPGPPDDAGIPVEDEAELPAAEVTAAPVDQTAAEEPEAEPVVDSAIPAVPPLAPEPVEEAAAPVDTSASPAVPPVGPEPAAEPAPELVDTADDTPIPPPPQPTPASGEVTPVAAEVPVGESTPTKKTTMAGCLVGLAAVALVVLFVVLAVAG